MRATRHIYVTYQVLAHTKTPAGCFLSDPAGSSRMRGVGAVQVNQTNQANRASFESHGTRKNSASKPEPAKARPRRTAELALRLLTQQALTSQRGQTRHRAEILLLITTGQHLRGKHLVKRHTRRNNRQVLVVQAVGQHHKT